MTTSSACGGSTDALPDESLIAALEKRRGKGRNDYPVEAMWRALMAGMVFQHPSIEALLRELNRNPVLFDACGSIRCRSGASASSCGIRRAP